jgi:hypothetical protein
MTREPVFDNDVMRVQQIRNMGVVEGDEPVSPNEWEQIKGKGSGAVEKWIDDNMKYRRCVVVLIGQDTANRRWVRHEIMKAWNEKRGLLGIYIHNLKCPRNGTCVKGVNPFSNIKLENGTPLSNYIACHEPNSWEAYADISRSLEGWVATAITQAKSR